MIAGFQGVDEEGNTRDGRILWKRDLTGSPYKKSQLNTYAATTPAVGPAPGNVAGTGKNVPRIAMAHEIPYVATATVAELRDELGDLMPPSEFILAAETYNRVTMVDRWVVENVLKWMADHRSSLDNFGGFAINVSGHSVNDESFADVG